MDIYTSDEKLHRRHSDQCKRDRFIVRYLAGLPRTECKRFAHDAEEDIIDRLRSGGHYVSRAAANDHYDLIVDGLRIEVKAAALSGGRYQANLRSNEADVIVFVCHDGTSKHSFVIPFDRVRGLTHIEIRNTDPDRYAGWMAAWKEAWQLIDQLIARGVNHWQPALL